MICNSYQAQQTTCLESFHFLCTYPRKDFSAWAEVWSGTWPSMAPIMASRCYFLQIFRDFGWAGDILRRTGIPNTGTLNINDEERNIQVILIAFVLSTEILSAIKYRCSAVNRFVGCYSTKFAFSPAPSLSNAR